MDAGGSTSASFVVLKVYSSAGIRYGRMFACLHVCGSRFVSCDVMEDIEMPDDADSSCCRTRDARIRNLHHFFSKNNNNNSSTHNAHILLAYI